MLRSIAAALTTLVLWAAGSSLTALAQTDDPAPVVLSAEERVLFVPNLGVSTARGTGLTVQNAGQRPARFMAVYFGVGSGSQASGEAACLDCGARSAVCSPPVAPGRTWTFAARPEATGPAGPGSTQRDALASAVVYSLNARAARDYGPAWSQWLREHPELDAGATMADIACSTFNPLRGAQPPEDPAPPLCDRYRAFHAGFVHGAALPVLGGLPFAPIRGEPIAGVAAVAMPTAGLGGEASFDRLALDRYAAVPLVETGALAPESGAIAATAVYTSHLPGVYLHTPDGQNGTVFVQNAGTACAAVTVLGFRSTMGMIDRPVTLHVPAGGWTTFRPEDAWPDARGSVALRLTSDRPIAAAASNLGYLTGATHTALRARNLPVAWAIPRAYQPPRPLPLQGDPVLRGPGRVTSVDVTAEGWETNVAVLNPAEVRDLLRLETQAPRQPPRDASYPMEPLTQLVFQLGLGLGLTGGGPGWGRLSAAETPLAVALESIRVASDVPAVTESWATAAWPYDPTGAARRPRAFALPDLGGPAIGGIDAGRLITRTAAMTDTLVGRILVQSLYTGTARIALDSFGARCGYIGSATRVVDRYQTIEIPLADLPGTAWGADAAVVRVLEGEVAVLVEIARPARTTVDAAAPDATSAYLGLPLHDAPAPPALARARLEVVPRTIAILDAPAARIPATVRVADAAASGRCIAYHAASDAAWVRVETPAGSLPGDLRLVVDTTALAAGTLHTANVTVTADAPAVDDSPQTIVVQVRRAGGGSIYLPALANGEANDG